MLKSIQSKIVILFMLIILSVLITAGTFMLSNVSQFYYDSFMSQMENNVFDSKFEEALTDAVEANNQKEKIEELLEAYYGKIGINSYRNYALLDGNDGSYISGSGGVTVSNLEITGNLLSALNGKIGNVIDKNSKYMDYAYPVTVDGSIKYVIYVYETKDTLTDFSQRMLAVISQALLIGVVIAILVGFLFSRTITRPIKNVTVRAEKIAKGFFDTGKMSNARDEIGELTNTFVTMGKKLKETVFQLEDQKSKIETILEYSSDGIVAFDTSGKLILINPEAKKLLKIEDEKTVEFNSFFSQMFDDIVLGDFIYIENENQVVKECAWNEYYLKFYFARFTYSDNTPGGLLVDVQNITQMQKLDVSRREFVANVSHELRTPLTTLKAYLETLQSGGIEEETQKRFFDTMSRETDRMTRLVSDLLTLSRLDNGIKLNLKYMHIEDILSDVAEKMSFEAKNKNQTLEYTAINEIPPIPLDEDRMEQVIINITSNALKYTPENGKVEIFSSYVSDNAVIRVKDNGIGIAKQHLGRLFERFYRVDKARSREQGGTGLGLAIAKEIVNAHAGEINIRSEVNVGTEIIITIPVEKSLAKYIERNEEEIG